MNGTHGISRLQKAATLREYANAVRTGNTPLAQRIRNANGKWITKAEFDNAKE